MAKIRSSYALDTSLVEQGEWVTLRDGIRVLVRSVRSEAVKKARQQKQKKFEKLLPAQKWKLLPHQEDEVTLAVVLTALIGWEGIEDEDGTPIPYSYETAKAILSDPTMVVFREEVMTAAGVDDTFRKEAAEEIAGNS